MELRLSLPRDVRFAETVGSVVVHAARHAGHPKKAAEAFARRVQARVRESLEADAPGPLPIVVRYDDGPVEVLVNGHTLTLDR